MLFVLCQRDRKDADIRCDRKGKRNMASVYVDGELPATSSSEQKENAKLHADKADVNEFPCTTSEIKWINIINDDLNVENDIEEAKHKLYDSCGEKKWPNPEYIEFGRDDEKKDVFFVKVETKEGEEGSVLITGSAKPKLRDAQSYTATRITRKLHKLNLT